MKITYTAGYFDGQRAYRASRWDPPREGVTTPYGRGWLDGWAAASRTSCTAITKQMTSAKQGERDGENAAYGTAPPVRYSRDQAYAAGYDRGMSHRESYDGRHSMRPDFRN